MHVLSAVVLCCETPTQLYWNNDVNDVTNECSVWTMCCTGDTVRHTDFTSCHRLMISILEACYFGTTHFILGVFKIYLIYT